MSAISHVLSEQTLECQSVRLPTVWNAKIKFAIVQGPYTIKTADSIDEFYEVLQLRKDVFLKEFSGQDLSQESDFDELDRNADFLIIKKHEQVIASYRLISSMFSDKFYSATEFDADNFLQTPDSKLELSRACVRKQARTTIALHLLWRGLAEYMTRCQARYLFGCSSVQTLQIKDIITVYNSLYSSGVASNEFSINPKKSYRFLDIDVLQDNFKFELDDCELIPPLLWGYIKAGAKIHGAPAIDLRFSCIDFFTILDFNCITEAYHKKYVQCQIQ